jgi:glutathione S-transferase
VLALLDAALDGRSHLVGESITIADLAVYGYVHLAGEAGYELTGHRALTAWLDRVAAQPGYIEDVTPYPDNARPGAGASIYD